jgi:exonuclease VII small subunit
MTGPELADIGALVAEYEQALADLVAADKALAEARNIECECRNRVNNAQKRIDAWYNKRREIAPSDSDWKRVKGERHDRP